MFFQLFVQLFLFLENFKEKVLFVLNGETCVPTYLPTLSLFVSFGTSNASPIRIEFRLST